MPTKVKKSGKRLDGRPARKRYWLRGQLAFHKIRNLMRHGGLTFDAAVAQWTKARRRYYGSIPYERF